MSNRPSSIPTAARKRAPRIDFRRRYDAIESQREVLVARMGTLSESAQRHPAYKGVRKLLNETFRRAKLPKRLAVLEAAAWLLGILEKVTATGIDQTL